MPKTQERKRPPGPEDVRDARTPGALPTANIEQLQQQGFSPELIEFLTQVANDKAIAEKRWQVNIDEGDGPKPIIDRSDEEKARIAFDASQDRAERHDAEVRKVAGFKLAHWNPVEAVDALAAMGPGDRDIYLQVARDTKTEYAKELFDVFGNPQE